MDVVSYVIGYQSGLKKGSGQGVELPKLENPAGAAEIREGYEVVGANGEKVTGTMPKVLLYSDDIIFDETTGKISTRVGVHENGYIESTARNTQRNLNTLGAMTITPGAEDQVIEKYRWLTGDITVKAVTGGGGDGGDVGTGDYRVKVIDYDGAVLTEKYLNEGEIFTLPDVPVNNRLVFEGWSSPVPVTNNTVVVPKHDITIGPCYHTASGALECDILLTKTSGLSFQFDGNTVTGMTSVDWGDGTIDSAFAHTYSSYGEYTIKLYGVYRIVGSGSGGLAGASNQTITSIHLSESLTLNSAAFSNCKGLKSVSISCGTIINGSAFTACEHLVAAVCPLQETVIKEQRFYNCSRLKDVVINHSVSQIGGTGATNDNVFNGCIRLASVVIPRGVTLIGRGSFWTCTGLTSVVIPNTVKQIDQYAFSGCTNMEIYDFTDFTDVPELLSTSVFGGYAEAWQIRVPAALYDQWIAATNWSDYANYIVAV